MVESLRNKTLPVPDKDKSFIFWALASYIVVELAGMLLHPMWRDEIHPWAMAGASSSIRDLLQRKVVEGHPDLWYMIIYGLRYLGDNPLMMQLLHSAMAVLTVFLVLKYAPFTRVQRVLLVFGYFYVFEYAVITRNYAPGILLITTYLVLDRHRPRYLIVQALALFFLAQANVFGLILSVTFFITRGFEVVYSGSFRTSLLRHKASLAAGVLIVLSGLIYSVASVIPPATGYFAGSASFSLSQMTLRETIHSVGIVWKAWVPLPEMHLQFWDTNIIRSSLVQALLSLFLAFSAGVLFYKRRVIFFMYLTGLTGIIAFILMYYYGYIRHHGHLYILLIACIWMSSTYPEGNFRLRSALLEKYYRWLHRNFIRIFITLLVIQLVAGILALSIQVFVPFSAAKVTAQYIRHQNLDRFLVAGDQDVCLEPVAGYLNKEVFFFSRNAFSTYLIYDAVRNIPKPGEVMRMADSLAGVHGDTILLVMNYSLDEPSWGNLRKIRTFESSIRYDEIYYLYLLIPGMPRQTLQVTEQTQE